MNNDKERAQVIYIAGPITGKPDYKQHFNETESALKEKGWIVLNPASLPQGMASEKYMPICISMLTAADAIFTLPGWENSRGADIEHSYALYQNIFWYSNLADVPDIHPEPNTRLEYLYRDASNYKAMNEVVLRGRMTPEMHAEMQECCEDHLEMFIPQQLGLPLLRGWDVNEDDHPYGELGLYGYTNEEPTVNMSVEDLLEEFRKAKDHWAPEAYAPEVPESDEDDDE